MPPRRRLRRRVVRPLTAEEELGYVQPRTRRQRLLSRRIPLVEARERVRQPPPQPVRRSIRILARQLYEEEKKQAERARQEAVAQAIRDEQARERKERRVERKIEQAAAAAGPAHPAHPQAQPVGDVVVAIEDEDSGDESPNIIEIGADLPPPPPAGRAPEDQQPEEEEEEQVYYDDRMYDERRQRSEISERRFPRQVVIRRPEGVIRRRDIRMRSRRPYIKRIFHGRMRNFPSVTRFTLTGAVSEFPNVEQFLDSVYDYIESSRPQHFRPGYDEERLSLFIIREHRDERGNVPQYYVTNRVSALSSSRHDYQSGVDEAMDYLKQSVEEQDSVPIYVDSLAYWGITVTRVFVPQGRGVNHTYPASVSELQQKKSVVVVWNHDDRCFERAFWIAWIYSIRRYKYSHVLFDREVARIRKDDGLWKRIVQQRYQNNILSEWMVKARKILPALYFPQDIEVSLLKTLEQLMRTNLYIFTINMVPLYSSAEHNSIHLFLILHDHHYYVLTKPWCFGAHRHNAFCLDCLRSYERQRGHRCRGRFSIESRVASYPGAGRRRGGGWGGECDQSDGNEEPAINNTISRPEPNASLFEQSNRSTCESAVALLSSSGSSRSSSFSYSSESSAPLVRSLSMPKRSYKVCGLCGTTHPENARQELWTKSSYCGVCNHQFPNAYCLEAHRRKMCKKFRRCLSCGARYKIKDGHECDSFKCGYCSAWYPITGYHDCPIQQQTPKKPFQKILFFDIESCLEEYRPQSDIEGVLESCVREHHVPNCIVFRLWYEDEEERKRDGMPLWYVASSIESAGEFLFQKVPGTTARFFSESRGWRVIAHNGHGYDVNFFLRQVLAKGMFRDVKAITDGLGFKDIQIYGVHFLDSYLFLPSSLSKLAKHFGVALRKGVYPYRFNTLSNIDYHGPLPDIKYFKGYEDWYHNHEPRVYDYKRDFSHLSMDETCQRRVMEGFHRCVTEFSAEDHGYWLWGETVLYCVNDVDILCQVWLKYREILMSLCGVDPTSYLTASQVSLAAFQAMLDTQIPPHQRLYRFSEVRSEWRWREKVELFLKWKENETQQDLHFQNLSFKGVRFHGVDMVHKRIYHMLKCRTYGCAKCFRSSLYNGADMNMIRREARQWRAEAMQMYPRFVFEWYYECKVDRILRATTYKKLWSEVPDFRKPLNPRVAMRGGRTECFSPFQKLDQGCYFDVCSLYPTVMRTFPLPTSVKKVKKNPSLEDVGLLGPPYCLAFGLYYARVIPPKKLRIPVLPCKVQDKLMFVLCYKCAERGDHDKECDHNDDDRALTSCWTSVELNDALKVGYVLERIYECVLYETSTDLFKKYVDTFLKVKTASDGDKVVQQWLRTKRGYTLEVGDPSWEITDEERAAFVADYNSRYTVKMKVEELKSNPSMRAVAKLMLNSLWGKFCARIHGERTQWLFDDAKLIELITHEDAAPIKNLSFFSYEGEQYFGLCNQEELACRQMDHAFGNVALGCFVTAHARSFLLKMMQKYEPYVLYCDTDSVILNLPRGITPPESGVFLSEWTDELDGQVMVDHFVSLGPKSYAYKTISHQEGFEPQQVVKMKGVPKSATLCGEELVRSLLLEDMRDVLLKTVAGEDHQVKVQYTQFKKTHLREVSTIQTQKCVRLRDKKKRILFNKRRLMIYDEDGFIVRVDSVPWGYCSHD